MKTVNQMKSPGILIIYIFFLLHSGSNPLLAQDQTDFEQTFKIFKTLELMKGISGKMTLSGQHNKEPNADPDRWTRFIKETTGKYPALWSGDFLFNRKTLMPDGT